MGVVCTAKDWELYSRGMKSVQSICRSVEIGLRVIGVWPGMRYAVLHRTFWFLSLGVCQTFQYRYFAMHIRRDVPSELMDGLSTTMSYSLLYFKLIIFWTKRSTFYNILSSMATDWTEAGSNPGVNARSMVKMARASRRLSNVIIGLYSLSVPLYAIGVIVSQFDPNNARQGKARELLLKMELPFESNASPFYEIIMVIQFFHQLAAAAIAGVLLALIVSMILHFAHQSDLICQGLKEISTKSRRTDLPVSTLSLLICWHQKVIKFSNGIENLFSYIALMQFLWNTLVICALGFVIVSSLDNADGSTMLIKSLFFYIVITLEAFIICYVGEYITGKGKLIGVAAYDCDWYDLEPRDVKLLFILMMRSQKALTITIGKFSDLSLERFTTFIKGSASFVSVLKAVY